MLCSLLNQTQRKLHFTALVHLKNYLETQIEMRFKTEVGEGSNREMFLATVFSLKLSSSLLHSKFLK
jgi:hypothetical protein